MPKRGSNFIPLVLDTRLLMAINGKASKKKQLNATYIMALLVEHCKNALTKEAYEELKERYRKTVYEQKKAKMAKEKAKIERERRQLALKEKELAIKELTAESYREQTKTSIERKKMVEIEPLLKEKRDKERWIKSYEGYSKGFPAKQMEQYKQRLKEINERLKELGVEADRN